MLASANPATPRQVNSVRTTRPHVLVVDDEPSSIEVLADSLQAHYEVSTARSGEEAVAICERLRPDLVLLDIVMPGLDGYEVCRRLKSSPETSAIPVIFVTARFSVEDQVKGLEAGAIDFITKPAHELIVLARVKAHVALKRQADFMREQALTDPLTGIGNRRCFDHRLDLEWRRCRRNRAPLALIMIDIDRFKQYNDAYGHVSGDRCLVQVSAAMKRGARRGTDLLCRYGGEEFACLLPDSGLASAIARARELARGVENLGITYPDSPGPRIVTISCGVAALVPDGSVDPPELVNRADAMLYAAKLAGRNRTMPEPPAVNAASAD
ncbi:MAG: diguanylate cyclase domain-containing protein [Burkholderiales bacterium]